MSEKIFELISSIAKKDVADLKAAADQTELWDSLLHVELVVAIESEFDIFFSAEEISQIDTPNKILTLVDSKVAAQ